ASAAAALIRTDWVSASVTGAAATSTVAAAEAGALSPGFTASAGRDVDTRSAMAPAIAPTPTSFLTAPLTVELRRLLSLAARAARREPVMGPAAGAAGASKRREGDCVALRP